MKSTTYGLENCYIFRSLALEEITNLINSINFRIKTYPKNSVIFSPSDYSNTLSIVLSGNLEIQKIKMSGESIIVGTKDIYDIVAAPSVFSKTKYYAGTVIATKKSQLMIIEKEELTKLLMMNKNVMNLFLEFISNQVVFMNKRLELISHNTLKKKMIFYLLTEYKKNKSTIIQIPYSKKKWADYLNAQPPSISRTLSELEKENYIIVNKRKIELANLTGLYNELS